MIDRPLPITRRVGARSRTALSTAVLVVAALVVAACSGTTGGTAAPSAVASDSPATVQDLALTGTEYSFTAPASIPAGLTRVTLSNSGTEEHQAQVARLADGKTVDDLTAALATGVPAGLALLTLAGGPTGVEPGSSGSTTANLAPGAYVFLCFIPAPDGVPHLAKGMLAPIEVTGSAVEADVPAGDASVTLQDFAFVGLDSLPAGPQTVTVTNTGPQLHEATIVKLADGVAATDLVAMFTSSEAPPDGPPPFTSVGGVAGLAVGTTVSMDVDLEPGAYAYVCFVPDTTSGAPHAALGMIGALTVD